VHTTAVTASQSMPAGQLSMPNVPNGDTLRRGGFVFLN